MRRQLAARRRWPCSALLGGRLLGESDRSLRLLGAACMAGGVMALACG